MAVVLAFRWRWRLPPAPRRRPRRSDSWDSSDAVAGGSPRNHRADDGDRGPLTMAHRARRPPARRHPVRLDPDRGRRALPPAAARVRALPAPARCCCLAAASSSFQAGPGPLKALSPAPSSAGVGILPREPRSRPTATTRPTGRCSSTWESPPRSSSPPADTNRSWCCSTPSPCSSASWRGWPRWQGSPPRRHAAGRHQPGRRRRGRVHPAVNLGRGYPLLSLAATALIAAVLYLRCAGWRGSPGGSRRDRTACGRGLNSSVATQSDPSGSAQRPVHRTMLAT